MGLNGKSGEIKLANLLKNQNKLQIKARINLI